MAWRIAAIASPWFSFPSAFVVAGCGSALDPDQSSCRATRDAAIWCADRRRAGLASFLVAYRASLALLSPHTSMYRFWDFAFLPVWPLPMSVEPILRRRPASCSRSSSIRSTWSHPIWPGGAAAAPGALDRRQSRWRGDRGRPGRILSCRSCWRWSPRRLQRYPFHGRLILELVPAFFC